MFALNFPRYIHFHLYFDWVTGWYVRGTYSLAEILLCSCCCFFAWFFFLQAQKWKRPKASTSIWKRVTYMLFDSLLAHSFGTQFSVRILFVRTQIAGVWFRIFFLLQFYIIFFFLHSFRFCSFYCFFFPFSLFHKNEFFLFSAQAFFILSHLLLWRFKRLIQFLSDGVCFVICCKKRARNGKKNWNGSKERKIALEWKMWWCTCTRIGLLKRNLLTNLSWCLHSNVLMRCHKYCAFNLSFILYI